MKSLTFAVLLASAALAENPYHVVGKYDVGGERIQEGGAGARMALPPTMSAQYDAADRLKSLNGSAYTYDGDGNLTSQPGISYSWNARGQLEKVTTRQGATSLRYDQMRRRPRDHRSSGSARSQLARSVPCLRPSIL